MRFVVAYCKIVVATLLKTYPFILVVQHVTHLPTSQYEPCNTGCIFVRYLSDGTLPSTRLDMANSSDTTWHEPFRYLEPAGYVLVRNGLDISRVSAVDTAFTDPYAIVRWLVLVPFTVVDKWRRQHGALTSLPSPKCAAIANFTEHCAIGDVKKQITSTMSMWDESCIVYVSCMILHMFLRVLHDWMLFSRWFKQDPNKEEKTLKVAIASWIVQVFACAACFLWCLGVVEVSVASDTVRGSNECACYYRLPGWPMGLALATPAVLLGSTLQAFNNLVLACQHGDYFHYITYHVAARAVVYATPSGIPPTSMIQSNNGADEGPSDAWRLMRPEDRIPSEGDRRLEPQRLTFEGLLNATWVLSIALWIQYVIVGYFIIVMCAPPLFDRVMMMVLHHEKADSRASCAIFGAIVLMVTGYGIWSSVGSDVYMLIANRNAFVPTGRFFRLFREIWKEWRNLKGRSKVSLPLLQLWFYMLAIFAWEVVLLLVPFYLIPPLVIRPAHPEIHALDEARKWSASGFYLVTKGWALFGATTYKDALVSLEMRTLGKHGLFSTIFREPREYSWPRVALQYPEWELSGYVALFWWGLDEQKTRADVARSSGRWSRGIRPKELIVPCPYLAVSTDSTKILKGPTPLNTNYASGPLTEFLKVIKPQKQHSMAAAEMFRNLFKEAGEFRVTRKCLAEVVEQGKTIPESRKGMSLGTPPVRGSRYIKIRMTHEAAGLSERLV